LEQSFLSVFIGWFPIIALIAVWLIFMRKQRGTQATTIDYMKKQVELTERLALAVERAANAIEKKQ
jgi:ATP-dependent Zn protease